MKTNHHSFLFFVALLVATLSWPSFAQTPLDQLVREGLSSNLVLKEKGVGLEQARLSLDIARSYFLPSVNVLADYTSGKGGRNIAMPLGDLLNPVYATLNQLTDSEQFPTINNVSQDFFPYNFYDARIRTSLPVINTDLHMARNIERQKVEFQELELQAYKRQLIFDIKMAYYSYLSGVAAVNIYESALKLVDTNVKVNESLMRNGKNLHANLLRAQSEAENVKAELNDARARVANAGKYLNFLVNRPLDSKIDVTESTVGELVIPENPGRDFSQREELAMISKSREINVSTLQLHRLSRLPKVSAFLDLGAQGMDWQFNDQSKYYLFGVQLTLPVFQGFRNNIHVRQSRLGLDKTDLTMRNTMARLEVEVAVASNELLVATQNLEASRQRLKSSRSYFNLIEKGFQQGVNTQIEFIDARNQLTQAELNVNLRQFDVLIASARIERETSSYQID